MESCGVTRAEPITHLFLPRYQLMSFTNKYWSHPAPTNIHLWTNIERGESTRTWRFFAVGTVSNSPHSYNIQSSLFCAEINENMVLHKKTKKMTYAKFEGGWNRVFDIAGIYSKKWMVRSLDWCNAVLDRFWNRKSSWNSWSYSEKCVWLLLA